MPGWKRDMKSHFSNESMVWIADTMRQFPEHRDKFLECFWRGQIESKAWLIDTLNYHVLKGPEPQSIYIFGGWYGILATMLFDSATYPILRIRSIDLDPQCESVADHVNKYNEMNQWRFKAFTSSMDLYDYDHPPTLVINTSCEHVDQDTYDRWYDRIPSGTMVVLQGNDFFACPEHVRCSQDIEEFKAQSRLGNLQYASQFKADAGSGYTRFMLIGTK